LGANEKVEVVVSFLTEREGGRSDLNWPILNDGRCRPHLVIENPEKNEPTSRENYIGVMFVDRPCRAEPGTEFAATVLILFQTRDLLPPSARFSIREGSKKVGSGIVKRWLS
jgi:hypothetical protein